MNLLYRGSVKDIYKHNGKLLFKYSDRYSVFDWGEMPDEIPRKGEALAAMASMFFEYLHEHGITSHYRKYLGGDTLEVDEVAVIRPPWKMGSYDYSVYRERPVNCLVPLEVIFRYYLGQGNSLSGRLQKNPNYMRDLGLQEIPTVDHKFQPALVECSTKLESTDRYLTRQEILELDFISEDELSTMKEEARKVAGLLEKLFNSFGVKLWDGKFEFAFSPEKGGQRGFFLVDSIGPDELRLTYEGLPLSKEFLRQLYSSSSWLAAVKEAKSLAKERASEDWKGICRQELKESPAPLAEKQIATASLLYKALANEIAKTLCKPLPFEVTASLPAWRQACESL